MTPLSALKAAVNEFEKRPLNYCLIGGHAASLYRRSERLTKDVDFALLTEPYERARQCAEEVITAIGLTPAIGFFPDHTNRSHKGVVKMITSTPTAGSFTGIIDVLLPVMPWVADAVQRAQFNRIDLIFAHVPIITPEDLIIAKAYALNNASDRFQDLDDIKEIFGAKLELDLSYIRMKLEKGETCRDSRQ